MVAASPCSPSPGPLDRPVDTRGGAGDHTHRLTSRLAVAGAREWRDLGAVRDLGAGRDGPHPTAGPGPLAGGVLLYHTRSGLRGGWFLAGSPSGVCRAAAAGPGR